MIGVVAQDDANLYGLMFKVASRKKIARRIWRYRAISRFTAAAVYQRLT